MKKAFLILCACLVLLTGVSMTSAATYTAGQSPTISEAVNDDAYISGSDVTVSAPVLGELFAAGDRVNVTQKPGRSVFAAGNTVTLSNGSGYNVFAAGNDVTIKGDIAHDVFVAGNRIVIDPSTVINGTLHIAGNNLTIAGTIKGNVEASGTTVTSNAVIGGDFKGDVNNLRFTGGSIAGDLTYKSPSDADGLNTVTVTGATTRTEISDTTPAAPFSSWLWGALATLLTGLAMILLVPRKVEEELATISTKWLPSLGWGFVALVVTPIAAMILIATMIGAPLGLILLTGYFVLLYLAGVIGQIFVGSWILNRFKNKSFTGKQHLVMALVVGIVAIGIVKAIPVIGTFIAFLLSLGIFLPALGAKAQWLNGFIQSQNNK